MFSGDNSSSHLLIGLTPWEMIALCTGPWVADIPTAPSPSDVTPHQSLCGAAMNLGPAHNNEQWLIMVGISALLQLVAEWDQDAGWGRMCNMEVACPLSLTQYHSYPASHKKRRLCKLGLAITCNLAYLDLSGIWQAGLLITGLAVIVPSGTMLGWCCWQLLQETADLPSDHTIITLATPQPLLLLGLVHGTD